MKPAPEFVDVMPHYRKYTKKNSLIHRLQAGQCELCGRNIQHRHIPCEAVIIVYAPDFSIELADNQKRTQRR